LEPRRPGRSRADAASPGEAAAEAKPQNLAAESADSVVRGAATPSRRSPRLASGGAIREAAATLFLERGYQGTSLDEIAAAAKVSKQTIYTHFANKEELFADLVLGNADRVDQFVATMLRTFNAARDVESGLHELARLYVRFLVRPEVLQLRRLVIAEAGRYPALARTYYERVPQRVYAALAALFSDLSDQGRLRIEDPLVAAHQFAWLTIGMHLDHGMFFDPEHTEATADLDRTADSATRVFLAAYATKK
jgi:TetR/AcrR family transcriptional regulator, mexJK operon transcriptional repressor